MTLDVSATPELVNILLTRQQLQRHEWRSVLRHYGSRIRLLVDSGAYEEMYSKSTPWTPQAYGMWTQQMREEVVPHIADFVGFFSLDKIKDPRGTRENYDVITAEGYDVLPILTRGATQEDAEHFMRTGKRIGVGALDLRAPVEYRRQRVEQLPTDYPQHWLGIGAVNELVAFNPPTSVDNATWVRKAGFGVMASYIGGGRLLTPTMGRPGHGLTRDARRAHRRNGVSPERIMTERDERGGYTHLTRFAIVASNAEYMLAIQKALGTQMFFAGAEGNDALMLIHHVLRLPCLGNPNQRERWNRRVRSGGGMLYVDESERCSHA